MASRMHLKYIQRIFNLILHALLSSACFSSISTFSIKKSRIPLECQTVWIQIRPDGPDLGPNCLQMLSVDDTSRSLKAMLYLFAKKRSIFRQLRLVSHNKLHLVFQHHLIFQDEITSTYQTVRSQLHTRARFLTVFAIILQL